MSDDRLALAEIRIGSRRQKLVTFTYSQVRQMYHVQFEKQRACDDFVDESEGVIIQGIDRLTKLQTTTCSSSGNRVSRFRSPEGIYAEKERRKMERRWKKWRGYKSISFCKYWSTNLIMNKSRANYYGCRIASFPEDSRNQWAAVKDLRHISLKDSAWIEEEDHAAHFWMFVFFVEKFWR